MHKTTVKTSSMEFLPKPPNNDLDFAADIIVKLAVRSSIQHSEVSPNLEITYRCELEPVLIVILSLVCACYLTVSLENRTLEGK